MKCISKKLIKKAVVPALVLSMLVSGNLSNYHAIAENVSVGGNISSENGKEYSTKGFNVGGIKIGEDGSASFTNVEIPELSEGNQTGYTSLVVMYDLVSDESVTLPTDIKYSEKFTVDANRSRNRKSSYINITNASIDDIKSYISGIKFNLKREDKPLEVRFVLSSANQSEGDLDKERQYYHLDKNDHYYIYVPFVSKSNSNEGTKNWIDAYNEAKEMTYMGQQGYLATITSPEEELIVQDAITSNRNGENGNSSVWAGGSRMKIKKDSTTKELNGDGTNRTDIDSEVGYDENGLYYDGFESAENGYNLWYWACGPERGEIFFDKDTRGGLSVPTDTKYNSYEDADKKKNAQQYDKHYHNWPNSGQPDANTENCLVIVNIYNDYRIPTGYANTKNTAIKTGWNDQNYDDKQNYVRGMVVEFGSEKNSFGAPTVTDTKEIVATALVPQVGGNYIKKNNNTIEVYKKKSPNDILLSNVSVEISDIYYTGKPIDSNVVVTKVDNTNGFSSVSELKNEKIYTTIEYKSTDGKGYDSASAPKDIGKYTMEVTISIGGLKETITKDFAIYPSPVFIPQDDLGKTPIPSGEITSSDIDKVRVAGEDRIATSINLSKSYYKKADQVVVANAWSFPDALSASVLASILKAPILLNNQAQLDSRVGAEISRIGAKDVIMVGGQSSLGTKVESSLSKIDRDNAQRVNGDNRYSTSVKIAEEVFKATKKSDTVVIASGENFADSLSAAGFASKNGYPIVLVKRDTLPSEVENLLKKYNVKNTIIVGGENSISTKVANSIKSISPNQERIAGVDRYDTSVKVASLKMSDSDKAFIASGKKFADALVVGAIAGQNNQSVILVSDTGKNTQAKNYIQSKIKSINVIGGMDTVPNDVVKDLFKK